MKKWIQIWLLALACVLFSACGSAEPEAYAQSVLPEPDRIEVVSGANTIVYEKEQEQYGKILCEIGKNWWKITPDDALMADHSALTEVTSLKQLKTTSNRTYRTIEDTLIIFVYAAPICWTVSAEEEMEIKQIKFILPDSDDTQLNVKGFYTIAESDGIHEGLYTYYYSPQLTSGFWEFLKH